MRRHDAACAVLGGWCEDMGCQLESGQKPWGEVLVPWAAPACPQARMDLVIHAPGFSSPFYVDLTVVSALSTDALSSGSADRSGAAAELASRGKHRDYPNCTLTPFVIEDHGRLGEKASAGCIVALKLLCSASLPMQSSLPRPLGQGRDCCLARLVLPAGLAGPSCRPLGRLPCLAGRASARRVGCAWRRLLILSLMYGNYPLSSHRR